MEFRKKLKVRLYTAIVYVLLGIAMIAISWWKGNEMLSSLGLVFTVMGLARIAQYKRITRSEDSIKQREIAETDERNVKLWKEARALAFSMYIFLGCITLIVLHLLNMAEAAMWIGYSVLSFVAIYWLCYAYISRKY